MKVLALPIWRYPVGEGAKRTRSINLTRISARNCGLRYPGHGTRNVGDNSPIEWTDATWNPVTGCTKISPGCKHCYAERLAKRLEAMGQANYRNGFKVTLQP